MKIGRTSNFSLRNKPLQLQKCNTDTVKKLTMGIRAIYRFYRKPRRPGIPSTQRHGVSENLPVFTSFCHQKKASVSTKDKLLWRQSTKDRGDRYTRKSLRKRRPNVTQVMLDLSSERLFLTVWLSSR